MKFLRKVFLASFFLCQILSGGVEASSTHMAAAPPPPPAVSSKDAKLNSNNDHGFWLFEDISHKFDDQWSCLLHMEQRWGSDYSLFWYQEYDFTVLYDLTKKMQCWFNACPDGIFKSFSLGLGVSEISRIQKNTKGVFRWVWFTRPELEAHIGLGWKDWSLKQRLRAEYIDYNSSHYKNHGNFRWRLALTSPWSFTCYKIAPFFSNEFFFREDTFSKSHPNGLVGGLYENRLRVGLSSNISEDKLIAEVWWQWRPLKQTPGTHPRWFNTYQWGSTIKLAF